MSTNPNWVFRLANTKTFEDIIEITQARSRQLQLYLNKPGSLSFDLPLEDSQTREFFAVQTCVKAYRNGELVWSGPVWTINDDANSNKTQIGCVGWFELLNKRSILEELQYTDTDAGSIAFDLYRESFKMIPAPVWSLSDWLVTDGDGVSNWDWVSKDINSFTITSDPFAGNGYQVILAVEFSGGTLVAGEEYILEATFSHDANDLLAGGATMYITETIGFTSFAIKSTQVNSLTPCVTTMSTTFTPPYDIPEENVLPRITLSFRGHTTMITCNASYRLYQETTIQDIPITIGTSISTQPRTRTYPRFANVGQEISSLSEIESGFDFEVHSEQRTLDIYDRIGDIRDVVFGYNWGPSNLKNVVVSTDASRMVNRFIAVGQSNWTYADEESKQDLYGVFSEIGSAPNTNESLVLGAYANAEIALRSDPVQTYQIEPYATGPDNVPSPFEDYNIGDIIFFTAKKGNIEINNQAVRIFGMSIGIDDNGLETVSSIQTLASG